MYNVVSAYAITEHFAEIALASSMQNIVFLLIRYVWSSVL